MTALRRAPKLLAALVAVSIAACSVPLPSASEPDPQPPVSRPAYSASPTHLLPVGDGRWTVTGPRRGADGRQDVWLCAGFAATLRPDAPGAEKRGPWMIPDGRGGYVFDPAAKPHISGDRPGGGVARFVSAPGHTDDHAPASTAGTELVSNGLPVHEVGVFPVAADDPARVFDRNPNRIAADPITAELVPDADPGPPRCATDLLGVLVSGARLLSAVDARGNDAVAWEVQDLCSGHPRPGGDYHYHGGTACTGIGGKRLDASAGLGELIGVAVDGLPITGATVTTGPRAGERLTSAELDACHGTTGPVTVPGASGHPAVTVTTYHYVVTDDWPYTVSCLHGSDSDSPPPAPASPAPMPTELRTTPN